MTTEAIPGPTLIDRLNWRYATKQFDPTRTIPADTWATLERSVLLSPSSFGLQPWRAYVVTDRARREKLVASSWGQRQVADASHLFVFAGKVGVDEAFVDRFIARTASVRGSAPESLAGYRQMILGAIKAKGPQGVDDWSARQAYLAMGVLLTTAANLAVDSCPMEGVDGAAYDRELGIGEQGYATLCVVPLGYRAAGDKYATLPKVRPELTDLIRQV